MDFQKHVLLTLDEDANRSATPRHGKDITVSKHSNEKANAVDLLPVNDIEGRRLESASGS